jgi:hypothetical protein
MAVSYARTGRLTYVPLIHIVRRRRPGYNWGTPDTYGTSYFGIHPAVLNKGMPNRNG